MRERRAGRNGVQIVRDCPNILCDRPLIVVQHDDETLGVRFNIVERFVADPACESGIARYDDNVLVATAEVAPHRHAQRSGERRPRMTCAVTIVFAFGAQKEAVEPAELPHRIKTIEPPGKQFVDVALMTDVHNEPVVRRVEDPVQRYRQFDHTEIWAQMPSGLGKNSD